MKMANGENPKRSYGSRQQAPATRMAVAALQRRVFVRPQEYRRKWDQYRKDAAAGKKDARSSLQTGYESYVPKTRVLLFEAAVADANGMGFDRALRAITLEPVRLLGLADRLGSLEPGKDADVVAFDGDPFEYTTNIDAVVVGGQVAYRRQPQPAQPLPAR